MARRKQLNIVDKILLGMMGIILVSMLLVAAVTAVISPFRAKKAAAYHDAMNAVLTSVDSSAVTGDKAVAFIIGTDEDDTGTYSKTFIPEELVTDNPAEVRYVATCTSGSDLIGFYSNNSGAGYQRWRTVEITDLKLGRSVDERTFHGTMPPNTVTSDGAHYGSSPSEEVITQWILDTIRNNTAEVPAETEPPQTEPVEETKPEAPKTSEFQHILDTEHLSYLGLVDYLEKEGYSHEEAVAAADQCDVDWKEQATKTAGFVFDTYAKYYSFVWTPADMEMWLTASLEESGYAFTLEEVQYAIAHCSVDWNKQASDFLVSMQSELNGKEDVVRSLEFCGFTPEQIAYALEQNGY